MGFDEATDPVCFSYARAMGVKSDGGCFCGTGNPAHWFDRSGLLHQAGDIPSGRFVGGM